MEVETMMSCASSESAVSCRICKFNGGEDLVASPCLCKGSMGSVHVSCLEEWLTGSCRVSCELCETPFHIARTRRYGCVGSMWVFLRDYVNPVKFSRDMFFLAVSLMNALILAGMWFAYVFRELATFERGRMQLGAGLVQWMVYFFFFTLCLVFASVNALDDVLRIFSIYCKRWYRWWQSAVDVKLILEEEDAAGVSAKPKDQ